MNWHVHRAFLFVDECVVAQLRIDFLVIGGELFEARLRTLLLVVVFARHHSENRPDKKGKDREEQHDTDPGSKAGTRLSEAKLCVGFGHVS